MSGSLSFLDSSHASSFGVVGTVILPAEIDKLEEKQDLGGFFQRFNSYNLKNTILCQCSLKLLYLAGDKFSI